MNKSIWSVVGYWVYTAVVALLTISNYSNKIEAQSSYAPFANLFTGPFSAILFFFWSIITVSWLIKKTSIKDTNNALKFIIVLVVSIVLSYGYINLV